MTLHASVPAGLECAHTPPASPQSAMHAPGSNPANPAAAAGGPACIFTSALDRRLRALEEAPGRGLQVATEVDAGAVLTQLVAPGPGGQWGRAGGWFGCGAGPQGGWLQPGCSHSFL